VKKTQSGSSCLRDSSVPTHCLLATPSHFAELPGRASWFRVGLSPKTKMVLSLFLGLPKTQGGFSVQLCKEFATSSHLEGDSRLAFVSDLPILLMY
jgi:hypothetical protein